MNKNIIYLSFISGKIQRLQKFSKKLNPQNSKAIIYSHKYICLLKMIILNLIILTLCIGSGFIKRENFEFFEH